MGKLQLDWATELANLQDPDVLVPYAQGLLGHLAASRRRQVEGECAACGRRFVGTVRRVYCEPTCTKRGWRRYGPIASWSG